MPRKIVSWECETCGVNYGYGGYELALGCELDHIADTAAEKTKAAIEEAFRARRPE